MHNRDVEVAAGHRYGPYQGLFWSSDGGFGRFPPRIPPGVFHRELPHVIFLSAHSSIVKGMPRPDRSRAALIETAATLFRRQGYAATGLNQILGQAGVKPGSLYHHFPQGKQQLGVAVIKATGTGIEQMLRRFLADDVPVADIVDRWIDLLVAGLAKDERDGCPVEPVATESVNASPPLRAAAARAFQGWCLAIEERLRAEGWLAQDAENAAVAVIALIEGALIISRVAGDPAALKAAKPAARSVLGAVTRGSR